MVTKATLAMTHKPFPENIFLNNALTGAVIVENALPIKDLPFGSLGLFCFLSTLLFSLLIFCFILRCSFLVIFFVCTVLGSLFCCISWSMLICGDVVSHLALPVNTMAVARSRSFNAFFIIPPFVLVKISRWFLVEKIIVIFFAVKRV